MCERVIASTGGIEQGRVDQETCERTKVAMNGL
jgi:hypothetical protein